jgi:protein O-GlcNAc transferase
MNLDTLLSRALALHKIGKLVEARDLYERILDISPDNAQVLNLLGATYVQAGEYQKGLPFLKRAISIKQDHLEAYNNLGIALKGLNEYEEAIACFRKALALKPGHVVYFNLGNVLKDLNRQNEAIDCYRKALILKPDYADACNNLGIALKGLNQYEEAIDCYRKALTLKPDFADAYNNLGVALKGLNQYEEAIACYRKALTLKPDFADAYNNLGISLKGLNQYDEAIASYRQAISIKPDYAAAYSNLGIVYREQGRLAEAIASYGKALEIKPDHVTAYGSLLFLHAYHATLEPAAYLSMARGWELACVPEQERNAARKRSFHRLPLAGRRLKIGYVSGDFWQHAVSYFIEQLFASHDRERVELFAYSAAAIRDAVTDRLQAMVEHWLPVATMSDTELLERIEADGIDVLIDLSGHTTHNRLGAFARRAAPVQVHYLGYFASTGLSEMDYFIGDAVLTPPEFDHYFIEQVWRLPRIRASYNGNADTPLTDWRPDPSGIVRVGSFNNLGKFTPQTVVLWAKVLHALPQGKLLLKTKALADPASRRRILEAMEKEGIPPERIELQSSDITPGWMKHMAYYDRLDIALDPVGAHGGYTTTCDALWMGAPVITLEGDRMASRMTASILSAIGHSDWVARSEAEYVDKVVALAKDVEQRRMLRPVQRERMAASPLCDAKDLAMKLEDAYFEMAGLRAAERRRTAASAQ